MFSVGEVSIKATESFLPDIEKPPTMHFDFVRFDRCDLRQTIQRGYGRTMAESRLVD